jgi:hypothetical protein
VRRQTPHLLLQPFPEPGEEGVPTSHNDVPGIRGKWELEKCDGELCHEI